MRENISDNAIKVVNRLNKMGFDAYLVGGSVRDLILNKNPKDFDIVTNATPEEVRSVFRNSRIIGRRFKLVHITFRHDIIEVATFRGFEDNNLSAKKSGEGMLLQDNIYGTIDNDAIRRDITINALYYNLQDCTIRDYCDGISDLNNKIIRLIGDPETRYREDPVRILRVIRFAAKLNMNIEQNTENLIYELGFLLSAIPAARLFDESLKLLQTGNGYSTYLLLKKYNIFSILFPYYSKVNDLNNDDSDSHQLIKAILKNTDSRLKNNNRVHPAFLFAAILWHPLIERAKQNLAEHSMNFQESFSLASQEILNEQCKVIGLPKRITAVMNTIWHLQNRLTNFSAKQAMNLLSHPKFRAGFDFLEFRGNIEQGNTKVWADWWKKFQFSTESEQESMLKSIQKNKSKYRSHPKKNKKNGK